MDHDSRIATFEHIHELQRLVARVMRNLLKRLLEHDQSKLHSPEREVFDQFPDREPYGTEAYRVRLLKMAVAIRHHHQTNSHHPEFYPNGVRGMSLMDLVEMLLDWWATASKHPGGDIRNSIELNQARFGYSDELKQILLNTLDELEKDGPW